jgi:hypothetical protein
MFKEIKILATVHLDAFVEIYKERTLNVEMPDQWSTIDKPAEEAMIELLTHYLKRRWREQIINCIEGKQQVIQTLTLRKRAVNDLKTAIDHDTCCNDPILLSQTMVKVNERVKQEIAEEQAKWDRENPIILDEGCVGEGIGTRP